MKYVRVVNVTQGTELARRARVASSFFERTIGLLATKTLPAGDGRWLFPCRSIHTLLMRYPIDVIFLDRTGVVLYQRTLPPWRLSRWVGGANGAVELPVGTLEGTRTRVGDRIEMKEAL
jgi:uncharacterized membrane protein (UPF0127 family)